jgi:hypothetical protein
VVRAYAQGDVPAFATTIATIGHPDHLLLFGGPALTDIDNYNFCTIAITNAGPQQVVMGRNFPIGTIEHLDNQDKLIPLTVDTVDHLLHVITDHSKTRALSDKDIAERINLDDVPTEYRARYLQMVFKHRKVISASKNDLGRSQRYNHRIHLKDLDPVYVKQFPSNRTINPSSKPPWKAGSNLEWFGGPNHYITHPFSASPRKRDKAYESYKTSGPLTQKPRSTNTQ